MRDKYANISVIGLEDGSFYSLQSCALVALSLSIITSAAVLIAIFHRETKPFKSWNKNDRFIVYLAATDGLYSCVHFSDHLHMTITRDHVRPIEVCTLYVVLLVLFLFANALLVLSMSVNAFALVKYQKVLNFGRYDWRLFAAAISFSITEITIGWATDSIGPTGAL